MPPPPKPIKYNPNRPLRAGNGTPFFLNAEHQAAYNNRPPASSALSKYGSAAAKVGITPLLLRNVLSTMSEPNASFGDTGYSKQAQVEKSLYHLLPDLLQNGLTSKVPLVNIPIDMAYYENMPRIDNAYQQRLNSEYSDRNVMDKSLRMYGGDGDGQYFIRDLSGVLSNPILQNAAKTASTLQLPKSMQGYRGHVAGQAHGGNYGKTIMDLLQDVLNPAYHLGPSVFAPLVAAGRADFGVATGKPMYYNNVKDKNGHDKKMTALSVLGDSFNMLSPLLKKDLKASVTGFGRNMQDSFIP